MADPLITYLQANHPKYSVTAKANRTTLEYAGPYDTLNESKPEIGFDAEGAGWGYKGLVSNVSIEPITGTDPLYGKLTIDIDEEFESDDTGVVEGKKEWEVEWVCISRNMLEHPVFNGGENGLSEEDIINIEKWRNEEDTARKKDYEFKPNPTEYYVELSANAKKFAKGILLGIETYEDFAPVVRRTTKLRNGQAVAASRAGKKDEPPNFVGKPSGYEWRKSADRSVKGGKQNEWIRTEEWTGCKKVLVDYDTIYF